jgi:hypothetical protein
VVSHGAGFAVRSLGVDMPRIGPVIVLIGLLAGGLLACEPSTSIPSGAQQVHVVATTTNVSVDPASVHAGDVYLVLDVVNAGVDLIGTQPRADASPGPLSAADLGRLARGDTQGFSMENLSVNCCGKVVKKVLVPGRYAIVPAGTEDGTPPPSIAVLEVMP